MKELLTATEIKENWEAKHEQPCNCELCYVHAYIETIQNAFFIPLIAKTKEILRKQGVMI